MQHDINLERRYKRLGLTQTDLANIFGTGQDTISQWKTNKREMQFPALVEFSLRYLESLSDSELERLRNDAKSK